MIPSVSTEHSFVSFFGFLHLVSNFRFFDLKYFCKLGRILTPHLLDELYGPVSKQEAHGAHDVSLATTKHSSNVDFPAQHGNSNCLAWCPC